MLLQSKLGNYRIIWVFQNSLESADSPGELTCWSWSIQVTCHSHTDLWFWWHLDSKVWKVHAILLILCLLSVCTVQFPDWKLKLSQPCSQHLSTSYACYASKSDGGSLTCFLGIIGLLILILYINFWKLLMQKNLVKNETWFPKRWPKKEVCNLSWFLPGQKF